MSYIERTEPGLLPLILSGLRIAGTVIGWLFIVAVWAVIAICAVVYAIAYVGFFMWLGGAIADEVLGD